MKPLILITLFAVILCATTAQEVDETCKKVCRYPKKMCEAGIALSNLPMPRSKMYEEMWQYMYGQHDKIDLFAGKTALFPFKIDDYGNVYHDVPKVKGEEKFVDLTLGELLEISSNAEDFNKKYRKTHSKHFKSDVVLDNIPICPFEKMQCLIFLEPTIFVTDGWRSPTSEQERKKVNPECSPHVLGYAIDIRPANKLDECRPTDWRDAHYDCVKTQALVDLVLEIDPCAKMLFNDPAIEHVSPYDDHDNHIHISWGYGARESDAVYNKIKAMKTAKERQINLVVPETETKAVIETPK